MNRSPTHLNARAVARASRSGSGAAAVSLAVVLFLVACSAGSSGASGPSQDGASHPMSVAPASEAVEPTPSASEDPLAVCAGVEPEGEPVEIIVGTASYSFDPRVIEGPIQCQPFVIVFTNSDAKVAGSGITNKHNITIRAENLIGPLLFDGEVIGNTTIRYEVPGLPAGEQYMYCKIHPGMSGRVMVAPAGG